MKHLVFFFFLFIYTFSISQRAFIDVQHNKVLGTLSFLNTAAQGQGSSQTYIELINSHMGSNPELKQWVEAYKRIDLRTNIRREQYPKKRHSSTSVLDLLWIASANALDIDDFAVRTIGILPPNEHAILIKALKGIEEAYTDLVWRTTQAQRLSIEEALNPFKPKIEDIFKKVSKFMGAQWPESTPFNIILYPIPESQGSTSGLSPKEITSSVPT